MPRETDHDPRPADSSEEPPPFLRSWPRLYTVVLIHLAVWIVIFYLFTIRFDLP